MDTLAKFEGNLTAVGNRVLVSDMEFGEQTTKGGIILTSDDGNVRGIYPRWGKVHSKGPRNDDPYEIGQWILIEHGRWTRGVTMTNDGEDEMVLRMVECESILAYADERPEDVLMSGSSIGCLLYTSDAADE